MRGAPSRWSWSLGLLVVQVAALVATTYTPALGTAWWHHVASLGLVLAAAVVLRGPMHSRRFLAIGVLATTVLATLSGFWLLYWKEGIRVDGYQDWGVWWHVAWSWAAAVFFWQHSWVNRVTLGHFFRRSLRSALPATVHLGLYGLSVVGLLVTAGPGKAWFHNESYIGLSVWTWLVVTVIAYVAWWSLRRREYAAQKRIRGGVDLALVPAAVVVVISGTILLWMDSSMDAAGLRYASKYWHVGPSVLFSVLVFVHSAQLWTTVLAHWRNAGRASAGNA